MSRSVSYTYEIQRAARREAYLSRIQSNAKRFYQKYLALFNDLVDQGLDKYMPSEFASVKSRIEKLGILAETDPEMARDLSFQIGSEISSLPANARSVRQQFFTSQKLREKEEADQKEKCNKELAQHISSLFRQIIDPVEQDFALEELNQIKKDFEGRTFNPDEVKRHIQNVNRRFTSISSNAKVAAEKWKKQKAQENIKESNHALIELHSEQARNDNNCNPEIIASVIEQLDALKDFQTDHNIAQEIEQTSNILDEAVTDENCRKIVVRAILESLEKAKFVVNRPKRVLTDKDEVIIYAKKPAGAQALFKVAIDGSMVYKFDHYEGTRCKEDIDQVLPLLEEIYGVKLSDERVLWENPDRISKSSKPSDHNTEVKKNV